MTTSKEEAVRQALLELGEVPAEALAAFITLRFGLKVEARFIPVLRASLVVRQQAEHFRARAGALATGQDSDRSPRAS